MSSLPCQDLSPSELDELLSAVLPEIPGYRVVRLLGRGGMSYVYLGIEEALDRQVAIKVISPLALNDEVSRHRFEKEARTIAKLQHPGIVAIHAVGRMEWGLLYYVMPYLSNGHIGKRDLRSDQARVIGVLRALLGALDYAHAQGIVHRDVKAENVLFDQNDRPMLTDFGIATSRRDRSRMTGAGTAIGSWGYMAPEQARGEVVDGRADLYSVGVLTFEMLTGRLPFHNQDTVALALMHAMDPVPALPPDKAHWQSFVQRAMAKTPETRFAGAREMLVALDRIALTPRRSDSPQGAASVRFAAWIRALPSAAWLAVAAVLVLITVLVTGLMYRRSSGVSDVVAMPAQAPVAVDVLPAPTRASGLSEPEVAPVSQTVAADDEPELPGLSELPPGEAALLTAGEQIRRHRLTQPAGASAMDALLEAHRLLGRDARVTAQAERWLGAVRPYLTKALQQRDDAAAKAMLAHVQRIETTLTLGGNAALDALHASVVEAVRNDLRTALGTNDLEGLRAARARAAALDVEPARLEPEYSRQVVTANIGTSLEGAATTVIVRMPEGDQPGLAVMPAPVTQQEYRVFATATGRAASLCRIRTTVMTVKTRNWKDPGFAQAPDHPVVCISPGDARAYAVWLGQRDGVTYRMPGTAEWRLATGVSSDAACGGAGVHCEAEGTRAATAGGRTPGGVYPALGNVREWPGDCIDCRAHPVLGLGWRDGSPSRRGEEVNPEFGYDDVGFRLVREVPRAAVEQR
ncbi:bifunctional serine/threonine-protein kinase/formylglycine-generating enzyme family protein [Xanthomonadaceae bacterium XH05]|nr:bifunctional serine/threonine-protein kinase/formylglycine-generating enzyme family protein [Xanthomonadaceae bacterium XH05]